MEKQLLNSLIENIPHCIWWKDLDSNLIGCNKNLATFLGYNEPQEIIGKSDFELWGPSEAEESIKIDKQILQTGKPLLNYHEKKTKPNGEIIWLSKSKLPLKNDQNEIIGTIGWHNDITELKNQAIEINDKKNALLEYSFELENVNKNLELNKLDLERFTYAVSHDLQSPIKTINSFSKLLQKRLNNSQDQEAMEFIDYIIDSSTRMEALVKNILLFARSGIKETQIQCVNIKEIIEEKISDLIDIINERSAIVNLNIENIEIHCYPDLIGLVFYNLINNGLKYNESSKVQMNLKYSENSKFHIFQIEDNGIGIKNEYKQKVFEPFQRLNDKYPGSGIGLSICQRAINLHNGNIWIEDNDQGGTIFYFTIAKNLMTQKNMEQ